MPLFATEIFSSIQGESLCAGRPCVFVRLSGCNLRCSYCDTTYAYEQGTAMSIRDIIRDVKDRGLNLVEITGGEPLHQERTPALIQNLLDCGHEVMMETNGTFDISKVDSRCIKIVDVKCPSSGESQRNDPENLQRVSEKDQLKFVIGDRGDYVFAKATIGHIGPHLPPDHVLLSPVTGKLKPSTLAEWMLADHLEARLHLQIHKVIWPGVSRGV